MKKTVLIIFVLLALVLSACSAATPTTTVSQSTAATVTEATGAVEQVAAPATASTADVFTTSPPDPASAAASATASTVRLSADYTDSAPVVSQLLAGIYQLEGSDLAVTQAQASVLLPLWQQVFGLSGGMRGPGQNNTAAAVTTPDSTSIADTQAQVAALLEQIQALLSDAQLQAIADLKLTQASAQATFQSMVAAGPGQMPQGGPGQPPQDGMGGSPQDGQGGQPPQGGLGRQGGAPLDGAVSPMGLFALLQLLQERAGQPAASSGTTGSTPAAAAGSSTSAASAGADSVYTVDGTSETLTGQTYAATEADQTAVFVTNDGDLSLSQAAITSSGDSSSTDSSSFYGLNAAVLASAGGTLDLTDSTIDTSGIGANGAFATGSGSSVSLANVTINATGDGGHAVMATQGGALTVQDVNMSTSGASASAIATDRGGGTIVVSGGAVNTAGMNSAGIYSTGGITVTGTTFTSTGAEVAVIEGANSITLNDADLITSFDNKWGVMIYQSMSGDAEGAQGVFAMTGGSLADTAANGPLFYVTNSTGIIMLKNVQLSAGSGVLVQAATGNWGNSGANGGTVVLTADGQTLTGDLLADAISSISATLQNGSILDGAINPEGTAQAINLTLDGTSTWNVTADSYLTTLSDPSGISGTTINNITGNGYTVYYDAGNPANNALNGQTYTLAGGGYLKPI